MKELPGHEKARIFVGTPAAYGEVKHVFHRSMLVSQLDCLQHQIFFYSETCQSPYIQQARNFLVSRFLEMKACTHLMWIDNDLGWDANAISRMVERDVDVISGVYPTKDPKCSGFPYYELGPVVDGLQPVRRVPGGFMLIKRHVVEAVVASCKQHTFNADGKVILVPYIYGDIYHEETQQLAVEDFAFCDRLIALGFKIWVETNITFAHVGSFAWVGNLQNTINEYAEKGPPVMDDSPVC